MIQALQNDEVRNFIHQHENEDPYDLSLKASKFKNIPVQLAIEQIRVRKKAKKKLPEWYKHSGIIFPHGVSIEQCSSEVTAKYKSTLIQGERLVDLTGGSGVDTWYLSQSFSQTTFIEPSEALCHLARHNFNVLGKRDINILQGTAEEFLEKNEPSPDWYFLDPSRRDNSHKRVFLLSDCQPNLDLIQDNLLKAKKGTLIKLSPLLDLKSLIDSFPSLASIDILSVDNDCKELLLTITNQRTAEPIIRTINWQSGMEQKYQFYISEDRNTQPDYSEPLEYLYEPNASVLKSGAFRKIGTDFGFNKLHPNSHLYTSQEIKSNFPGRAFRLEHMVPLKPKLVRKLSGGKANIATRNFPMTVAEIRKKTGIKEGGENYIFATTIPDGSHKLLLCKKV